MVVIANSRLSKSQVKDRFRRCLIDLSKHQMYKKSDLSNEIVNIRNNWNAVDALFVLTVKGKERDKKC